MNERKRILKKKLAEAQSKLALCSDKGNLKALEEKTGLSNRAKELEEALRESDAEKNNYKARVNKLEEELKQEKEKPLWKKVLRC